MSVPVSVVLQRTACVIKLAHRMNESPYHWSCRLFEAGSCLPVVTHQWGTGETPQAALKLWQIFPKRVWGWTKWRWILYLFLNLSKFVSSQCLYSYPVGLVYMLIGAGLREYCTPLLATATLSRDDTSSADTIFHTANEVKSELESFHSINYLSSQPQGLITQSQCVWKSRLTLHT